VGRADSFPTYPEVVNPAGFAKFSFEDFVYDEETREVRCGKRALELSPKALELLGQLLKNRPRAMSKAELRDALWPTTFVGDTSLARRVNELRAALGDDARKPRMIRTVYKFGYAFIGEATDLAASPAPAREPSSACWLVSGATEIGLAEGESVIGRDPDCTVRITSPRMSRRHARILVDGTRATLEDLGSKNGTYLEGQAIDGPKNLADGDEISVGSAVFVFRAGEATGTTRTGRPPRSTAKKDGLRHSNR
jgi:DNA-binding winged helix-turn-helix (wHTH) protein